MNTKECRTWT